MKTRASSIGIPLGVILFVLVFSAVGALAATHEITPWHGNHKGAVSITFDDGLATEYNFAFPALDQRGMKGTFFITTGDATWPWWIEVANAGHEIGAHGVGHPNFTTISRAEAEYQMATSQAQINANITSQRCLTFAFPYGAANESVATLVGKYFIAGRIVNGDLNDPTTDLNRENAFDINYYSLDRMKALTEQASTEGKWLVPLFHSFDPAEYPYLAWTQQMFLSYLDYLKAETPELWVAPFGTVIKYMRERGAATLSVSSQTDNAIELKLTDTLDNTIFNHPLTIRSEVPVNWPKVTMQQGTTVTDLTPVVDQGTWVVYYDALPDQGLIRLTNANASPSQVANDDFYLASQGHELKVAAPGLLQNDQKGALRAILVRGPAYGEVQVSSNGAFVYKPQPGFIGSDTFSYRANYGTYDSNIAVVTVTVMAGYFKEIVVNPKDVRGGNTTVGKVQFEHELERDAVVSLTLSSSVASAPATVTVPAGSKEAVFQITTTDVVTTTQVTITARYADRVKTFRFNVKP